MTILAWLAVSSLVWGAVIWGAGRLVQRSDLSGRARQWMWRGATALLVAPWIAAPFVAAFGLGLAPSEAVVETPAVVTALPVDQYTGEVYSDLIGAPAPATIDLNLAQILLILLAAGWIVRFVAAQLAMRSLMGIVAQSRGAEHGPALVALDAWRRRLGLRRAPRLRIVAESISPFSYGVIRPVICLPEGLEDKLSREALDLVVGHETLHVARGDGWRRPLERITADILWFNPFAWLIRRELDVARELACDEGVVELSSARHAYARTLRDVAGFSAGLSHAAPAASMSLAGGRSLMLRVTRTLALAKRKPARAALIAACLLGAVGAPIAVAQVMLATPAPPPPPEVPAIAEVPEAIAALEAPPAPEAPQAIEAPEAPEPPVVEQQVYVSQDGKIRASFSAKVTSTGGSAGQGYSVGLAQVSSSDKGDLCIAHLDGLGALSVAKDQTVAKGQVIGERKNSASVSFTVHCTDELDAQGRPVFAADQPAPPAPPAPLAPLDATAGVAPIAPIAPSYERYAPPAPMPLPTPYPAPAPLAAPQPPPAWDQSPTPLTPPTPPAYAPTPLPPLPPQPTNLRILDAPHAVVEVARTTSGFGYRVDPFNASQTVLHTGVDLAAGKSVNIYAPAGAIVVRAENAANIGNVVELKLTNGYVLRMGQLDEMKVKPGDAVKAGSVIGTMGSSGLSTGPHLHFEVLVDGKPVDPAKVQGLVLVGAG